MRGCPDLSVLAAYLDASLFPEERQRLEEHLARCATCAAVVADGLAFLERDAPVVQGLPRARGVMAAVAAALVAVLAAGGWWWLRSDGDARRAREARAEIFRALDGERRVVPRLSGGMPWQPPGETTRGAPSSLSPSSWALAAAAERARELANAAPTSQPLDALASAQLLLGDPDAALATLQRAAAAAPGDAKVRADLAAAYIARAQSDGGAHDLALAIEEAGVALQGDPSSIEARFNQALALEGLHLDHAARTAWLDVVARETDADWRAEARRHLLSVPAAPSAPREPAFVDTLLAAERTRSPALKNAYDALARGTAARGEMRFEQAAPLLRQAAEQLSPASAGHRRAALELLALDYFEHGDTPALESAASELGDEARSAGDDFVAAKSDWFRAVIALRAGAAADAVALYQRALPELERLHDAASATWLQYLLSEAYALLGDAGASWSRRAESLAAIDELRDRQRATDLLASSAVMSLAEDLPHTANAFLDELASLPADGDPADAAWAAIARARALLRGDRRSEAQDQLAAATRELLRIDSPASREVLVPDLAMTNGMASGDAHRAVDIFTRALPVLERRSKWEVPYALLERARAHRRAGELDAAAADLRQGIALAEAQRPLADPQALWRGERGDLARLYDEQVEVALARGRPAAAFLAAERGRVRALRTVAASIRPLPQVPAPADLAAELPADTALVAYSLDDRKPVLWAMQGGRATMATLPLDHDRLTATSAALRADLAAGAWTSHTRDAARALYAALIAPAHLDPVVKRLVVVVDDELGTLPFAALIDPQSGRFLIEERSLVVAPSIALYLRARQRHDDAPIAQALVLGDPRPDTRVFPERPPLPGAREEARRVAALYPQVDLAVGTSATRERLLAALPASGVVHIGAHLLLNRADPARSALLLSPDRDAVAGGAVYAEEIPRLRLDRTRVVVLAACDTADGPVAPHEGPLSFARAFLAAGTPDVVAALWPIADRGSVAELVALHGELRNGADAPDALRAAQLRMLQSADPALRSPAAWAAFQALGG